MDGSVLAQMGLPDMRVPIEYALLYPDRADLGIPRYDILAQETALTFAPPDETRFPSLGLARRAAQTGGTLPAVMNAANEAAVGLFLDGRNHISGHHGAYGTVMDAHAVIHHPTLAQIAQADRGARRAALVLATEDRSLHRGGAF